MGWCNEDKQKGPYHWVLVLVDPVHFLDLVVVIIYSSSTVAKFGNAS